MLLQSKPPITNRRELENKYPIRFRPEYKHFMFFDKQIENWRIQPATTNEISEILEEARTYIDENFEK